MEAFDFARKRCVEGRHHTVSVGRSESGEIYYGLQLNASRAREYSECAESGILHNSQLAYDPMVTLVTVRFKPDKTGNKQAQPDIAPPCGGCIERWRRYNPECMVILDKDGLFKFPVKDIFLFAYPTSN